MDKRNIVTVDYIQIITRILSLYYWIFLSVAFFILLAVFYDRYQEKTYQSEGLFLIDDRVKDNKLSGLKSDDLYEGVYQPLKNSNIKNQIIEFQTYNGFKNVVKNLNLELKYAVSGHVKKKLPMYYLPGITITFDRGHIQPINTSFSLYKIDDEHWNLNGNSGLDGYLYNQELTVPIAETPVDYTFTHAIEVINSSMSFTIKLDHTIAKKLKSGSEYSFTFYSYPELIAMHKSNLSFSLYEKGSTIMRIQYLSVDPELGIDFIDAMMHDYLRREISLKKEEGEKMLHFINKQLVEISQRMKETELKIKGFGQQNSSLELETQSNKNFQKIESTEEGLYDLKLSDRYYSYLQTSIDSAKSVSTLVFPFTLIEGDPLLIGLLERLNELSEEYITEQEKHLPSKRKLKSIQLQFNDSKIIVSENLKKLREDLLKKIDYKQNELNDAVTKEHDLPEAKLTYLSLKRDYSIDDEIYTFLLQSHTEMNVRLSAVTPNNRIINQARLSNVITGVERKVLLIVAIITGILLSSVFIVANDFFQGKILSNHDLSLSIKQEPLTTLGHYNKKSNLVINDLRNPIDEQFSKLRFLLFHKLNKHNGSFSMVVTSSQSKEGKTFTATNLALSMAYYGKKTLLLGADFRNPKLPNYFIQSTPMGFANLLAGQCSSQDILNQTYVENLHVIFSGQLETEHYMTLSEISKLENFFTQIKNLYDVVIVDTAPIGLSSETLNFTKHVDYILYVTRTNITTKTMLNNLQSVCGVCSKIPSDFILNDYKRIGSSQYPYTYKKTPKLV